MPPTLNPSPVGDVAPSGLLQRVNSVEEHGDTIHGDTTVVKTRQATLAETFERADFDGHKELNTTDVTATEPPARAAARRTPPTPLTTGCETSTTSLPCAKAATRPRPSSWSTRSTRPEGGACDECAGWGNDDASNYATMGALAFMAC